MMNRGVQGEDIFIENESKSAFLDLLKDKSDKMKIKVLSYCIMDNHYHLIIQDMSGNISDFAKLLNGEFGKYYRKKYGGKGYVFQGRYNSFLIQDDSYLILAITYVLLNPVRSQIVLTPREYIWSSVNEYFNERVSDIVDSSYVNQLFGNSEEFNRIMNVHRNTELVIHKTKHGNLLGEVNFIEKALKKYNRRNTQDGSQSLQKMRKDDKYIDPVEKVLHEFEKMHKIKVDDIDVRGYEGKRLRGELLVHLKDRAGLKYSEIIEFPLFSSVQHGSLGRLYQNARRRMNW